MDRSFLRHAAVYGLASLMVQAGGFVLLPIYLRSLGPGDFGVLEVVGRLAETVGTVLLFGGFRQALMTFYQQAPDELARRRVVGATFVLVIGSCVVGGVTALCLSPWLGAWLAPNLSGEATPLEPWLIRLAIAGILLEPLSLIPLGLLQARVESGRYVSVVICSFLLRVALCILFVRFLGWGVAGAIGGIAVTSALFGVGLSIAEMRRGVAWPGWSQLGAMIAFAAPMLPGGLCFFMLHHGDRFILLHWCDAAEIGLYSLGYKLAMVVAVFSLNPLYMVWSSHMYAVARREDGPAVFGQVFARMCATFLFVGLGLCLFAPEAVVILGGERYRAAAVYIAPIVLACFLQACCSLMDAGLYVKRRTGLKLVVTMLTTVVMLTLYALLIPAYGAMGAAMATLVGFVFLALATFVVSQRVYTVEYPWPRLVGMLALTMAVWLAGVNLPDASWSLVARSALWLAVPAIAWVGGLVRSDEKQHIRDLLFRLFARLRRSRPVFADR